MAPHYPARKWARTHEERLRTQYKPHRDRDRERRAQEKRERDRAAKLDYNEIRSRDDQSLHPPPDCNWKNYLKPENDWIREYVKNSGYRIEKSAPLAVQRMVWYRELDTRHTFRLKHFHTRSNYWVLRALKTNGDATPLQQAFVAAVDEGNGYLRRASFQARDACLKRLCEGSEEIHLFSRNERDFYRLRRLQKRQESYQDLKLMWEYEKTDAQAQIFKDMEAEYLGAHWRTYHFKYNTDAEFRAQEDKKDSVATDPLWEQRGTELDKMVQKKWVSRLRCKWGGNYYTKRVDEQKWDWTMKEFGIPEDLWDKILKRWGWTAEAFDENWFPKADSGKLKIILKQEKDKMEQKWKKEIRGKQKIVAKELAKVRLIDETKISSACMNLVELLLKNLDISNDLLAEEE